MGCLSRLPSRRTDREGGASWFESKGMLGLMFLKSYLNISDRQLLECYNTDWSLRYFCGKVLDENHQIKGMTIMTRIRACVEKHCEWENFQEMLISLWKQDVNRC
ncbi:transposase [Algoriphagus sp.]|uniref:transposase n=1 Tax=Algoriphagus sp. TaxID=1872435 RepID=UPI003F70B3B8